MWQYVTLFLLCVTHLCVWHNKYLCDTPVSLLIQIWCDTEFDWNTQWQNILCLVAIFERIVNGTWRFYFVHKLTLNQFVQNTLMWPWLLGEIVVYKFSYISRISLSLKRYASQATRGDQGKCSYHSQLYNWSLFGLVWCAKDYCGQMWYALHLGGLASSQLGHTGVSYVKQPGRWMLGRAQLFFPNFFWGGSIKIRGATIFSPFLLGWKHRN